MRAGDELMIWQFANRSERSSRQQRGA